MKQLNHLISLALCIFCISSDIVAQVNGILKDSLSENPVEFANVAVLNLKDSSFVRGAASDSAGFFSVKNIKDGEYLLRVSSIGYMVKTIRFVHSGKTDLGSIPLKPSATDLKAINVTAERPMLYADGEKVYYSVEDDPSVQTSTAADALQNAPGVEVDMEGNVSIRGAGSVDIWIDDKPSKMSGENLKMFLKTLPASAINRIEVITNPSSRYATASDAVINIVTNNKIKKNNFFGFGLNASSQPNAMPWLSYVWANDKMSFSVYAAGSLSNRRSKETYSEVSLKDTEDNSKDTVFREDSKSSRENKFYSGNLFMNFDYNIDASNTFSVWSMISGMSPVTNSETTLDRYDFDPYAFNRYESKFEYKDVYIRGNINMDYRHRFKKKGNIIFSLGMNRNNSYNNETDIRRYLNDNPTYENINRQSEEHGNGYGLDLGTRYVYPYSKRGEISCGISMDYSQHNSSTLAQDFDSARMDYLLTDNLRSYDFDYETKSANAYFNWKYNINDFSIQLSAGATINGSDFKEGNSLFLDDTSFVSLDLNPSMHLSYKTKNSHNFRFSYSLKNTAPYFSQLSTFKSYSTDSYNIGNRDLKSHISHRVELNWSKYAKSGSYFSMDAFYKGNSNEISYISDYEYDELLMRYVSFSKPYNLGSSYSYGLNANLSLRFGSYLNVSLFGNVQHDSYSIESYNNHPATSADKVSYYVSARIWTKIAEKYRLTLSANYSSPSLWSIFNSRNGGYYVNCGASADLLKGRLAIYVNVNDLFNTRESISGSTNPYYITNSHNKPVSRFISAGLTLKFGKIELEHKNMRGKIYSDMNMQQE